MGSRLEANSSTVRKRIEAHQFQDEDGEEYKASKFGGFSDYFRRKKIKLQNLDAERRSQATDKPKIFRGIVAHVNGYTQPSLNDLHAMIVDHGGGFLQYLDGKTLVTHIIAGNLTPKKKVEFRRYRIVKPAWVVDSIKAGKLLPWESYRVVDEGASQKILGFEKGSVVNQVKAPSTGYREQSDTSWYLNHVKEIATRLDARADDETEAHVPYPSSQMPSEDQDQQKDHVSIASAARDDGPYDRERDESLPLEENEESLAQDTLEDSASIAVGDGPKLDDEIQMYSDERGIPGPPAEGLEPQPNPQDASPTKGKPMSAEEHNAILLANPRIWKSTTVNPAFLKQYYEESRLHHLSAWKADLKAQLQAAAQERSASQTVRRKRPPGSNRYVLHVDFDSFFAAVSLKKYPEFVDQPTVVAHGNGAGSEIASCNYLARAYGVKNGMWMKSALQLCPTIKVMPYDFKAYEEASRDFYDVVLSTGGIVQSVNVDEALVDVSVDCIEANAHDGTGSSGDRLLREQAKADAIATHLRQRIKDKTGCAVSVGIGGNILLAKVAMRKAKPAGQYHIKPEEVLDFIGALNVQDLPGVAYSIGGKLEEIGVKLVKEVRQLTKERLISTLGPRTGEKMWEYARGIDRVEVGEQVIRKSVSAEVNWGVRFATQGQADEFVQSLCEELHHRLVREMVKGRQLTMKLMRRAADVPLAPPKHLGHGKCDTFNKSVLLGLATNAKEILTREALSIMHGWNFPPGELRGIGVQVTKLEALRATDPAIGSSQRRLQFKTTPTSSKRLAASHDPIVDVDGPTTTTSPSIHPAAAMSVTDALGEKKPLNTFGTQFVLPTQADAAVLAELPADVRSKLIPKQSAITRAVSKPAPPTRSPSPTAGFPTASQLDPEALDALPQDLRAEVLAFYETSPKSAAHLATPVKRSLLPQSPRKAAPSKQSKRFTPPKKRTADLLSRSKSPVKAANTLTQSNFLTIATSNDSRSRTATNDGPPSPDPAFLAALPASIRSEVLDHHRRTKLAASRKLAVGRKSASTTRGPSTTIQHRLHLPPAPPKVLFTAARLSDVTALRTSIKAWVNAEPDGPHDDDVAALVDYLQRVVKMERDLGKVTSLVKWFAWVVGDLAESRGQELWLAVLQQVEEGVQDSVKERRLGRMEF